MKELLKKYGIEIAGDKIKDFEKDFTAAFVSKNDLDTKLTELGTANQTIKGLKEIVKKFDGVDVDKLKLDLDNLQIKYDTDIAKTKLDSAIDVALLTNKVKNPKAVKALFEPSTIKMEGDKLLGLDEQIAKIKQSDSYLFESEQQQNSSVKIDTGKPHGTQPGSDPLAAFVLSARTAAGLKNKE